jgi:farnesyl diphosphate synthase
MSLNQLYEKLNEISALTNSCLSKMLAPSPLAQGRIVEAMKYSALNGGKRLRPFLLISTARMFNVPDKYSVRAAAALEMLHSYSLIHDDLPCMDNDDLRRGLPTCHKKYDEATAVLAGDGLLTKAFEILSDEETYPDEKIRIKLIYDLSIAAGADNGMIAGQMLDILAEDMPNISIDEIINLQKAKTGALIKYACLAGATLGEASNKEFDALNNYSEKIGLAFQITDDILDVEGTTENLGKTAGKDAQTNKATFISLLGLQKAKGKAAELVNNAIDDLKEFKKNTQNLELLAKYIIERKK